MRQLLRRVVGRHGKLAVPIETLGDDADLFAAGMDSLAVVDILGAIEAELDMELPDSLLDRRTFASIAALDEACRSLSPT